MTLPLPVEKNSLEHLNRSIGQRIRFLGQSMGYLQDLCKAEDSDPKILKSQLQVVEDKFKHLKEVHENRLELQISLGKLEQSESSSLEMDKMSLEVLQLKEDALEKLTQPFKEEKISDNLSDEASTLKDEKVAVQAKVKLPELYIKPFTGDLEDWQEFILTYKALIHDNKGISKSTKYAYLRGLLEGEAKAAIKHFPFSTSNYEEIMAFLTKRFGNEREHHTRLIQKLLSLERVTTMRGLHLERLTDELTAIWSALEVYGASSSDSALALNQMEMLIPYELQLEWFVNLEENIAANPALEKDPEATRVLFFKFLQMNSDAARQVALDDQTVSQRGSRTKRRGHRNRKGHFHNHHFRSYSNTS